MLSKPLHEEHGGLDPIELQKKGLCIDSLIDFSVNSNPFGPSPGIAKALKRVEISRYPDRNCSALANQLAELNSVSQNQILIGNGTAELIWLIAQTFLKQGDQVLIIGPTFSEYQRASMRLNASVTEISAKPPNFVPPIREAVDFIRKIHPRLVFLCNPNNPTGKYVVEAEVKELIDECGEESILVIDKAYSAFLNGHFFETNPESSVLVLRSMTKEFALAGLRLGYLLGNADRIARIKTYQPAWSVNAYAQAAGLAALSDLDYYRNTLELLRGIQKLFFNDIQSIGYQLIKSDVHFALACSEYPANVLRSHLLQEGFQVRDCTSFGLSNYIRICTCQKEENNKLIKAMKTSRTELLLRK